MTCEISKLFEKLYKDVENQPSMTTSEEIDQLSTLYSTGLRKQTSKQSSSNSNSDKCKSSNHINMDKPMALNEKKLVAKYQQLPAEYLREVWEIVCEG